MDLTKFKQWAAQGNNWQKIAQWLCVHCPYDVHDVLVANGYMPELESQVEPEAFVPTMQAQLIALAGKDAQPDQFLAELVTEFLNAE